MDTVCEGHFQKRRQRTQAEQKVIVSAAVSSALPSGVGCPSGHGRPGCLCRRPGGFQKFSTFSGPFWSRSHPGRGFCSEAAPGRLELCWAPLGLGPGWPVRLPPRCDLPGPVVGASLLWLLRGLGATHPDPACADAGP